jgi:CDP-diacylglycerol--serine O-phosphatidyltransferase
MITSGSVFCGMASLIMTYNDKFIPSAILIFFAVFFDAMDGKAARSLGGGSEFGEELDSLADAISFGVAPAFLMYVVYIGSDYGLWGALSASFFTLCGVLRLARFNVTNVPTGPFQGLPIPAGGLTLASFVMAGFPLTPMMAIAVMIFIGGLMVSSLQYCNAKRLTKHNTNMTKLAAFMTLVAMSFVIFKEKTFLLFAILYITTGLIGFDGSEWIMEESEGRRDEI